MHVYAILRRAEMPMCAPPCLRARALSCVCFRGVSPQREHPQHPPMGLCQRQGDSLGTIPPSKGKEKGTRMSKWIVTPQHEHRLSAEIYRSCRQGRRPVLPNVVSLAAMPGGSSSNQRFRNSRVNVVGPLNVDRVARRNGNLPIFWLYVVALS